jgi:RNA polymerase sigma-70 factor (ECF subfamily)
MVSEVASYSEDLARAARCLDGAPGAFEAIYRQHAPRLYGLAVRLVGRPDADDLLQEIFVTAHRRLRQYRGESALGTWLFRLGTNVCIDHLRRRSNRLLTDSEPLDDLLPTASTPALDMVARLDLERALAQLPAGPRTVFVLHAIEGLGHRDISEMVGIAEGTSKSHLHRARIRLRHLLSGDAGPTGLS